MTVGIPAVTILDVKPYGRSSVIDETSNLAQDENLLSHEVTNTKLYQHTNSWY